MADEGPRYQTLDIPASLAAEKIELRLYEQAHIAIVKVDSRNWRGAANAAFQPLANYIFGANERGERIGMTSPVTTHKQDELWEVRFFMPNHYDKDDLPDPQSPYVEITTMDAAQFAVIRFNGPANGAGATANFAKHETKLRAALAEHNLPHDGAAHYAVYNGPWTPNMMRRNEVLIELF